VSALCGQEISTDSGGGAGAQQQRRRSTAPSSNAGSAMLTAELTRPNICNYLQFPTFLVVLRILASLCHTAQVTFIEKQDHMRQQVKKQYNQTTIRSSVSTQQAI